MNESVQLLTLLRFWARQTKPKKINDQVHITHVYHVLMHSSTSVALDYCSSQMGEHDDNDDGDDDDDDGDIDGSDSGDNDNKKTDAAGSDPSSSSRYE